MRAATLSLTLVALLLAGCTAGPDFHVSDKAMIKSKSATGPLQSGQEKEFVSAPLPDHWWHLYDDPRLDGYIAEALGANTDLRAADANLRRASFIVEEAKAGRTIQTSITTQASIARNGGFTYPLPGTDYSYAIGAGISYTLDLAGGIRRGIEAARASSEAAQAARDEVRVIVAAGVARSYAAACSANVTLAATQHVLDVENQTLDVVTRLKTGGRGTQFDVTRARTARDQSKSALPDIIAERTAALYELAALMGRAPEDYPREVESCSSPPMVRQVIPIGNGEELLKRRPDIRAAERELHAATAQIGVETAALYPHVSLGGSMGFAGPFSLFTSGESFGGSLGPLVSWTFPNRRIAHDRIAEAGASAEAASANFDGAVIEALRQTETALSAYAREADKDASVEESRNDAQQSTNEAGRLYHFGRTDFINLLQAQATLATTEASLAQSRAKLVDRQIDLFLTLGGGWTIDPHETQVSAAAPKATGG